MPESELLIVPPVVRRISDGCHAAGSAMRRCSCLLALIWRADAGASAIEAAILLPFLLTMLLGIEEFGRALWTQSALQFAVEAAARCAAVSPTVCSDSTSTQTYASANVFGLSIPTSAFTVTMNTGTSTANGASCGITTTPAYTAGVEVTASYTFQPVVDYSTIIPISLDLTLNATSCHP